MKPGSPPIGRIGLQYTVRGPSADRRNDLANNNLCGTWPGYWPDFWCVYIHAGITVFGVLNPQLEPQNRVARHWRVFIIAIYISIRFRTGAANRVVRFTVGAFQHWVASLIFSNVRLCRHIPTGNARPSIRFGRPLAGGIDWRCSCCNLLLAF